MPSFNRRLPQEVVELRVARHERAHETALRHDLQSLAPHLLQHLPHERGPGAAAAQRRGHLAVRDGHDPGGGAIDREGRPALEIELVAAVRRIVAKASGHGFNPSIVPD